MEDLGSVITSHMVDQLVSEPFDTEVHPSSSYTICAALFRDWKKGDVRLGCPSLLINANPTSARANCRLGQHAHSAPKPIFQPNATR